MFPTGNNFLRVFATVNVWGFQVNSSVSGVQQVSYLPGLAEVPADPAAGCVVLVSCAGCSLVGDGVLCAGGVPLLFCRVFSAWRSAEQVRCCDHYEAKQDV